MMSSSDNSAGVRCGSLGQRPLSTRRTAAPQLVLLLCNSVQQAKQEVEAMGFLRTVQEDTGERERLVQRIDDKHGDLMPLCDEDRWHQRHPGQSQRTKYGQLGGQHCMDTEQRLKCP